MSSVQMDVSNVAEAAATASSGSTGAVSSSAVAASLSAISPPPPSFPSYLCPQPKDFQGYKLDSNSALPSLTIELEKELTMRTGGVDHSAPFTTNNPPTFLQLSQQFKTNQLVTLQSGSNGSHALYYMDHTGVWQVDPPSSQSSGTTETHGTAGGSHLIYPFDSSENGAGLSLVAVAPSLLLLTRAGGRLTIFRVNPLAAASGDSKSNAAPMHILFDGSPLSPAPLSPHDATISSALVSRDHKQLFIVLYEFWEERVNPYRPANMRIDFVHEGDALRSASIEAPHDVNVPPSNQIIEKRALHKLTLLTFNLIQSSSSTSSEKARADLVHTFSSVQNYGLPKEEMPARFDNDSNWSSPLASWLELPNPSTHAPNPTSSQHSSRTSSATPPLLPVYWFVIARVPYLNETESVVHEMLREEANKLFDQREQRQPLDSIPRAANDGASSSASNAPVAAESKSPSALPPFTSDKILSEMHNMKHYAIDQEDDDEEMSEFGVGHEAAAGMFSLNRNVDASVNLYDSMGNLLARRTFKQQTFLFAQENHVPFLKQGGHTVVAVKQNDDLLLYSVHGAPQANAEGLSLGAAGSVAVSNAFMTVPRIGIVLKPLFAYAGLGYVQSGKPHKKFFIEDGSHQFVMIAEHARHMYIYGRPSKSSNVAKQYLVQFPVEEKEEDRQILGLQSVIVPVHQSMAASAQSVNTPTDSNAMHEANSSLPVEGQPLVYLLTRRSIRQLQLPRVTLPA